MASSPSNPLSTYLAVRQDGIPFSSMVVNYLENLKIKGFSYYNLHTLTSPSLTLSTLYIVHQKAVQCLATCIEHQATVLFLTNMFLSLLVRINHQNESREQPPRKRMNDYELLFHPLTYLPPSTNTSLPFPAAPPRGSSSFAPHPPHPHSL